MLSKVVNIIFAILFLLSAALQYNDPDPYIWIPIYVYVAGCCALAAAGKFFPRVYVAGIIVYALYAIFLFFTSDGVADWFMKHNAEDIAQSMKATHPWIEQTREFFGLSLAIIALLLNYYFARKSKRVISV